MIESISSISAQPEREEALAPMPYWRILFVARWLQRRISQLLSRLHLLAITRGRSLRWGCLCRKAWEARSSGRRAPAGTPDHVAPVTHHAVPGATRRRVPAL